MGVRNREPRKLVALEGRLPVLVDGLKQEVIQEKS